MSNCEAHCRVKCVCTGRTELLHREIAAAVLGLPPGEMVHHIDGDVHNNSPENLVVPPSQGYPDHTESVLRHERHGQPHLFPEMLQGLRVRPRGSLFE